MGIFPKGVQYQYKEQPISYEHPLGMGFEVYLMMSL